MLDYKIRKMKREEIPLLEIFLYEAIFQRPNAEKMPENVIYQPELYVYIDDFGKESDRCFVAEYNSQVIGAVWTRILSGEIQGFGHLNDQTPEFAISVLEDFRGQGIGMKLMRHMLLELANAGYSQTSLAVQKDNYALAMYQALGFKIVAENDEEFIMLYTFHSDGS